MLSQSIKWARQIFQTRANLNISAKKIVWGFVTRQGEIVDFAMKMVLNLFSNREHGEKYKYKF